jgi:hypothetical protein
MFVIDVGFRRGLGLLLTGIAVLLLGGLIGMMGLLVVAGSSTGAGGFAVALLFTMIAGLVIVLVGAAMLAEVPKAAGQ